jgi:hypothetical protein
LAPALNLKQKSISEVLGTIIVTKSRSLTLAIRSHSLQLQHGTGANHLQTQLSALPTRGQYGHLVQQKERTNFKNVWMKMNQKKFQITRLQTKSSLEDLTLEDLEKSEQMLKDSLRAVGHMAGLTNDQIEIDWQLLKREAESRDIHISEL